MGARIKGIFLVVSRVTVVAAIAIAAAVILRPSTANAQVEYVRICSGYGTGYFYLPGTDICVNYATNDAVEATVNGAWHWRIPNNPRTWVATPNGTCHGGNLVKFGDISGSDLTQDAYLRWETNAQYKLKLKPGQYIGSVLYKGGFTGTGVDPGNFCMYYYNDSQNVATYVPLGCIDTTAQATVPATLMFTPDTPMPPATSNQEYVLGADGDPWNVTSAADIQGTLSIWLCVQNAHPSRRAH
jgi:hypothetical protein